MKIMIVLLFAFSVMSGVVKAGGTDESSRSGEVPAAPARLAAEMAVGGTGAFGATTPSLLGGDAEPAYECIPEECVNECTSSGCAGGYCGFGGCVCVKCDF